jgi:hypothetical protein
MNFYIIGHKKKLNIIIEFIYFHCNLLSGNKFELELQGCFSFCSATCQVGLEIGDGIRFWPGSTFEVLSKG